MKFGSLYKLFRVRSRVYWLYLAALLVILVGGCAKKTEKFEAVTKINIDTLLQLNTAIKTDNGKILIGAGARYEDGVVLHSFDTGNTFDRHYWVQPDGCNGFFGADTLSNSVYFSSFGANIAYATAPYTSYASYRIPGPNEYISGISLQSHLGLAAVNIGTDSGAIIRFDPQTLQFSGYTSFKNAIHDVHLFNNLEGIAVGSGSVMTTTDGGLTWVRQNAIGDNFMKIAAVSRQVIYVVGLSGTIIKTEDGGTQWTKLRNGGNLLRASYQLWDVSFLDTQHGVAVGEKGLVVYTADGGKQWKPFESFCDDNLRFVIHLNPTQLLVGGENGSLYKLTTK